MKMNTGTELYVPKSTDVIRSKWSQIVDEAMRKAREKIAASENCEPVETRPSPLPKEKQPA
jgi:hypothetical protein